MRDVSCPSGWTAAHWPKQVVEAQTPSIPFPVPANGTATQDSTCAGADDLAIGGGASAFLVANNDFIVTRESFPLADDTWRGTVANTSASDFEAVAHIICAPSL